MLFNMWLRKLREERGVLLMEPGQQYSEDMTLSALATWTGGPLCSGWMLIPTDLCGVLRA